MSRARGVVPIAALLLAACNHPPPPPVEPTVERSDAGVAGGPGDAGSGLAPASGDAGAVGVVAASPAPRPTPPARVKIVVRSFPKGAKVVWGKKQLGPTPVIIERPRDSGPIDLMLKLQEYFTVHTRAYTFRNDAFTVRMTKLTDEQTLFGAKKGLPEEVDGGTTPEGSPPPGAPVDPGQPAAPAAPAPSPPPPQ